VELLRRTGIITFLDAVRHLICVITLRVRVTQLPNANSRTPRGGTASRTYRPPMATRRPYSSTYVYILIQSLFCKTNSDILKRAPSLLEPVLQLVILAVMVDGRLQWFEIFKRNARWRAPLWSTAFAPTTSVPGIRDSHGTDFRQISYLWFLLTEFRKHRIKIKKLSTKDHVNYTASPLLNCITEKDNVLCEVLAETAEAVDNLTLKRSTIDCKSLHLRPEYKK
jgi:hypothetical protein